MWFHEASGYIYLVPLNKKKRSCILLKDLKFETHLNLQNIKKPFLLRTIKKSTSNFYGDHTVSGFYNF